MEEVPKNAPTKRIGEDRGYLPVGPDEPPRTPRVHEVAEEDTLEGLIARRRRAGVHEDQRATAQGSQTELAHGLDVDLAGTVQGDAGLHARWFGGPEEQRVHRLGSSGVAEEVEHLARRCVLVREVAKEVFATL